MGDGVIQKCHSGGPGGSSLESCRSGEGGGSAAGADGPVATGCGACGGQFAIPSDSATMPSWAVNVATRVTALVLREMFTAISAQGARDARVGSGAQGGLLSDDSEVHRVVRDCLRNKSGDADTIPCGCGRAMDHGEMVRANSEALLCSNADASLAKRSVGGFIGPNNARNRRKREERKKQRQNRGYYGFGGLPQEVQDELRDTQAQRLLIQNRRIIDQEKERQEKRKKTQLLGSDWRSGPSDVINKPNSTPSSRASLKTVSSCNSSDSFVTLESKIKNVEKNFDNLKLTLSKKIAVLQSQQSDVEKLVVTTIIEEQQRCENLSSESLASSFLNTGTSILF